MGFHYGVVQGPLGHDISGPELVAAVANAGAIGILKTPDWVFSISQQPSISFRINSYIFAFILSFG